MSFLLLREFFLFYIFLFYSYFYFAIDEEFVIFIVICFWILLFIIFYLKFISVSFIDNINILISEYFFFHNKKNMFLSIFKDQYIDFIFFNNFINRFLSVFYIKLDLSIKRKILIFYDTSKLYILELINFIKLSLKSLFILHYLTTFSYIYKILNLVISENLKLLDFFFFNCRNILLNLENKFSFNRFDLLKIKTPLKFSFYDKEFFNHYINKDFILIHIVIFIVKKGIVLIEDKHLILFFQKLFSIIFFFNFEILGLKLNGNKTKNKNKKNTNLIKKEKKRKKLNNLREIKKLKNMIVILQNKNVNNIYLSLKRYKRIFLNKIKYYKKVK
jgi:hypothetical protein